MALYFKNPGVADVRALTTLGVNVKETNNPIGFFGTGFKISVAGILKAGGSVRLFLGLDQYEFTTTRAEIRGEDHDIVTLVHPDGRRQELGFTTSLGKTWDPWMFYRELRCNATDENGFTSSTTQRAEPGHTLIIVDGFEQLEIAHSERHKYFLDSRPLHQFESCETHLSREMHERSFYYRGIMVGEWNRPSFYRWNYTDRMMLTEDRKCGSLYSVTSSIAADVARSDDRDFIRHILTMDQDFWERTLDFSSSYGASETFLNVAQEVINAPPQPNGANMTLIPLLVRTRNYDRYESREVQAMESKMLAKAEKVCKSLHLPTDTVEIKVVENLGSGVLGKVVNGKIYLSGEVFRQGTKRVAGTLIEEMIHLRYGFEDESREMQNHLLDRLVGLVEELQGEPL